MRVLTGLLALTATPALAHHEVVVATSLVPALAGLAIVTSAGFAALWRRWDRKRLDRAP